MICKNCGNNIQDFSVSCPYCGARVRQQNAYPAYRGGSGLNGARIANIFSALVHEKTPGAVLEFSFWCVVCVAALLSLIACIIVEPGYASLRVLWLFMMLFQLGLGVMMAFRIKPIMLLVSSWVFYVLMPIWFFAVTAAGGGVSGGAIAMFVFMLLAGIGLGVLAAIHFFSRYSLKTPLVIVSIVSASLLILMIICIYAVGPSFESIWSGTGTGYGKHIMIHEINQGSYWLGSLSYWFTGVVITLFYAFFFWGCIDSRKDKIYMANPGGQSGFASGYRNPGVQPAGIRCLSGVNRGRVYYMDGREICIGSGQGAHVYVNQPYVSQTHCYIRFNPSSGLYEVRDMSQTGVFLTNGARFTTGRYNSVSRGTVICVGSVEQQFKLL